MTGSVETLLPSPQMVYVVKKRHRRLDGYPRKELPLKVGKVRRALRLNMGCPVSLYSYTHGPVGELP